MSGSDANCSLCSGSGPLTMVPHRQVVKARPGQELALGKFFYLTDQAGNLASLNLTLYIESPQRRK
jgi:hypothetical protein